MSMQISDFSGVPELAMRCLNRTIEMIGDEDIEISELHLYEPSHLTPKVGFYFKSPQISTFITPSIWRDSGSYSYPRAIATIYKHLNFRPRKVFELDEDRLNAIQRHPHEVLFDEAKPSFVISEDKSVLKRISKELGFDYTFVVMDLETSTGKDKEFILGSTWDLYDGLRKWFRDKLHPLIDEISEFEKVVTYNGENYDFEVLSNYNCSKIRGIIENGKSLDLYRKIREAYIKEGHGTIQKRGELKLSNVAFATLGRSDYIERFSEPMPYSRDDLIDKCCRDTISTKDLLFFGQKNSHICYIAKEYFEEGQTIRRLPVKWDL